MLEPETRAALAPRRGAVALNEPLEHLSLILLGDAETRIDQRAGAMRGFPDPGHSPSASARTRTNPAVGELDRVLGEVGHDLTQPGRIAFHACRERPRPR